MGTQLTANAGPDRTVNAGDRVDLDPGVTLVGASGFILGNGALEVTGASAVSTDIVKIQWSKVEGVGVALSTNDTTSGKAFFIAPEVVDEANIKIVYQLKITNAAGKTAEDSLTVTVNRVNKKPSVVVGEDLKVNEGEIVIFDHVLSKDDDGQIISYSWRQLTGDDVHLSDTDKNHATFIAPAVVVETKFEFELTVIDNENGIGVGKVNVTVVPKNTPQASLAFPPKVGFYDGDLISAYGTVKAYDSSVDTVLVGFGESRVAAIVNSDGSWRAESLVVPDAQESTLSVEVVDKKGRVGVETARLIKGNRGSLGTGRGWSMTIGMGVDPEAEKIYLLGYVVSNVRTTKLFAIDLRTGDRTVIASFEDMNLGVEYFDIRSMTYNSHLKKAFVTSKAAGESNYRLVISIDVLSGEKEIVSNEAPFSIPYSIQSTNDGVLYVSDMAENKIVKVDAQGNKSIVKDILESSKGVWRSPAVLALDPTDITKELYIATDPFENTPIVKLNLDNVDLTPVFLNRLNLKPVALAYDAQSKSLFSVNTSGVLVKYELDSGKMPVVLSELPENGVHLSYDSIRSVLYVVADRGLYVIDPVSGNSVGMGVSP